MTADSATFNNRMDKVTSLEMARGFFLANSSGSVTCQAGVLGKLSLECSCYPEAEEFYADVERRKKQLWGEKADLLNEYGIMGGGYLVNQMHQRIN